MISAMAMLEHAPGVAYATDVEGRVVLANAAFCSLTSLRREDVLGRPLQEVLPLHLVAETLEHEQQVARVRLPFARQLRVMLASGEASGAERTWLVTKFPLRREETCVGIGTLVADVTDQVRDSDAARREASFVREVLELVPNPIHAKDGNHRFTFVNRAMAELLGASADQVLGRTELELGVPPNDVARSEHTDQVALDNRIELLTPEELRHDAEHGQRWFRTTRQPLTASDGDVEQLLVVATDITEYRNAQRAQLRLKDERMEAIGRLAGGIAHDLNNLLTVLQSGVSLLGDALGPDFEPAFVIEDMARASARAASLTQHLLAYSRRQLLRPERIDINRVVTESEGELRRVLGDAIELRLALEPGLPAVMADQASVGQVLINLIANARDAMSSGGAVDVQTRGMMARLPEVGEAAVVELAVEDDGHGIPTDVLDHVFEPFFTTKPQGKGTGLGLSLVHGIVRQSGGDVVVTSEPGRGARFSVRFPVAGPEGSHP